MFQNLHIAIQILIVFLFSLLLSCGSKKTDSDTPASAKAAAGESKTCSNLSALMEICAEEKNLNKRFRIDSVKSWIREDCESLGKENPSLQRELLECAQSDCKKMNECLSRFLQERKR